MSIPDLEAEDARVERELRINRQIALASGLFQDDVTVGTVLESLAEGIVVVDDSGTILLASTRIEQIYGLGNRQWDIPGLRVLIEEILPQDTVFNGYEVEHDFLDIGRKVMLLNARQIFRENIGSLNFITDSQRYSLNLA